MLTAPTDRPFPPKDILGRPDYTPPGLQCLADTIEAVGRSLYPNNWSGDEASARPLPALPTDNFKEEFSLCCRAGERSRKKSKAGAFENVIQPLQPDIYMTEHLASERWQQAVLRIRDLLYAERLNAVIFIPGGYEVSIPRRVWASADANGVFSSGRAKFFPEAAHMLAKPVEGWVFVRTNELEEILAPDLMPAAKATVGAETKCQKWLEGLMRDENKTKLKNEYREEAIAGFGVSVRGFDRAWAAAIESTGSTDWKKSGPKPKP